MKLLLYCTKAKPYLYKTEDTTYPAYPIGYHTDKNLKVKLSNTNELANLNGKIVAECDFEVEEIGLVEIPDYAGDECHTFVYDVSIYFETKTLNQDKLFKKSCLNWEEMKKYLYSTNGKGYAIHIKNLHIFDEPRFIQDYSKNENPYNYIENAPQNMMYAYDVKSFKDYEKYILISIRPEWLCKILNGEKTIEVRKKVLKEMLKNE